MHALSGEKMTLPRPMPFWQALWYFGVSALLFRICIYNLYPWLLAQGLALFPTFLISYILPLLTLFIAAIVAYKLEGYPWDWQVFATRFRLKKMTGRAWLLTIAGFVVGYLGSGLLLISAQWLAKMPLFAPPDFLPAFLTPKGATYPLTTFIGVSLRGSWWFVLLYVMLLAINIIGEEFWWRGYILPRQELRHGRWTWLIHGTMWALFHVPIYPWNLFVLLPTCIALAFVAQKTQNTYPGIIIHFVSNAVILAPITLAVLGVY